MNGDVEVLLADVAVRVVGEPQHPPTPEDVQALLNYAGVPLPAEYVDAMRLSDGIEGWFGSDENSFYIVLESCAGVLDMNESFKLKERGSSLLAVGGDGGWEAFAFDLKTGEWVLVNLVDLGSGEDEIRFPDLRAMLDAFMEGTAFSVDKQT